MDRHDITINLNNPKATVMKRDNYVHIVYLNRVIKLIRERIKNLGEINREEENSSKTFESLRMHDAILVDGKRGSGKTTFLLNLKAELEMKESNINVKVLDAIDPNQLDEKSNILLILLAHIYTELLKYIKEQEDRKRDKRNEYKKLTTYLHNITSAISASSESKYDDDYHKLYNLHESLIIAKIEIKIEDFTSSLPI
jgi:DNA polymerase III delta prime subunit